MLLKLYHSEVVFEESTEAYPHENITTIKYLDVWYRVGHQRISHAAYILNEKACWCSDIQECKKRRFGYFHGTLDAINIALRRDLAGRQNQTTTDVCL